MNCDETKSSMMKSLMKQWRTFIMIAVALLMFAPCSTFGHMRGPHHPRNSQPVPPADGHQHHHYVPRGSPGDDTPILTHDKNLLHDTEHIKEDVGDWVVADGKELTPEEMEFHYFKMHDFDNNSMLDGLEILQAISHVLPMPDEEHETLDLTTPRNGEKYQHQNPHKKLTPEELKKQMDEDFNYYIELIDKVLEEDDMNKDGYLSYFEYVVGRRREEKKEKALKSSNPT